MNVACGSIAIKLFNSNMTSVDINALVLNEGLLIINKGINAKSLLGTYTFILTYEYVNYPGPIKSNAFTIILSDRCNQTQAIFISPIPTVITYYSYTLNTNYTFACPTIPDTVCQ